MSSARPHTTTESAIAASAGATGIPREDIASRNRTLRVSRVRQIAMWAARQANPDLSLPMIGRAFDRDHTTVLHALSRIDRLRESDDGVRDLSDDVLRLVKMQTGTVPFIRHVPRPAFKTRRAGGAAHG